MSEFGDSNRRILARRTGWPAGALAECERLDVEHLSWFFGWVPVNRTPGWERLAGFAAWRDGPPWQVELVGGDDLYHGPGAGLARRPVAFGPGIPELQARIAVLEARIAKEQADHEWLRASIRRGLR